MDIFKPMKDLVCEAFSFRKYKALPLPLAIIIGIFLLPLWLGGLVYAGLYCVVSYFVSLIDYPIEALLKFVRNEAKIVNDVTQAFVYIIGFPVIVLFKVCEVLLFIFNYLASLAAHVLLYLATLCGVKFDLMLKGVERCHEAEEKNHAAFVKGLILVIIFGAPLVVGLLNLVFVILGLAVEPVFLEVAFIIYYVLSGFYVLGLIWIVVAFGTKVTDKWFVEKPKKEKPAKKEKPKKEEKVEEVKEEANAEEHVEEVPVEETPVEEEHVEETPVEEAREEQPSEEEKKEEHFDFSSLDEYNKNRRPADDYQAERLDDLEDDYDRR